MSNPRKEIDWSLTTWEGSRRAQLRRALALPIRERLQAAEDLAALGRRLKAAGEAARKGAQ